MLIESEIFEAEMNAALLNNDNIFRYCQFNGLNRLEEQGLVTVDATFLWCLFEDTDLYSTLLNCVIAVSCRFTRCTFRGVSFATCRMVDCEFIDCTFTNDNMGSQCTFRETVWCGSTQSGCVGLSAEEMPVRA